MKKIIFFIALFLMTTFASAAPVDVATAERVARNFWNGHHDKDVPALAGTMNAVVLSWDGFYLFQSDEATGFVIVATDDCIEPVLAYSFHNAAIRKDSIGREMAWWLDGWQQQIDAARAARLNASDNVCARWQALANGTVSPHPLTVTAPMVTTQWDQDEPYNTLCPSRNSWGYTTHAATGCVATAMAQVMRYWSYPQRGIGTHIYYSPAMSQWGQGFGWQTVDFGATTYDWNNMPNALTSVSSEAEINAVATLMYHCGVACDMMYGTAYEGGSGAFIHNIPLLAYGNTLNGMIEFFGYSSTATGIDRVKYDDSTWTTMVRTELDQQRPIIYAGGDETSGGHCFVCDGYDAENRFHFNWGWSGTGDGYYLLSHLAPGIGGTGGGTGTYDFTNLQQMLVGIQPHQSAADSSFTIRRLPYLQTFETAPAGWKATTSSDYSYSWMVHDTTGCIGNYSLYVGAPLYGTSHDTLFFPLVAAKGEIRISWIDRALGSDDSYYLYASDSLLAGCSATAGVWNRREATFNITESDSLQLMFIYNASTRSAGLLIDSILIESTSQPVSIISTHAANVTVYPNPASDALHISSDAEILSTSLFDVFGHCVLHFKGFASTIDLRSLPKGTYFLRTTTSAGASLKKIVRY